MDNKVENVLNLPLESWPDPLIDLLRRSSFEGKATWIICHKDFLLDEAQNGDGGFIWRELSTNQRPIKLYGDILR